MGNKTLVDKLIDTDFWDYPWWLTVWLGVAFTGFGVLVFQDESLNFAQALAAASVSFLLGGCMIAAGLIHRFSQKSLIQILRTQWWASLLFGFALFATGVSVSWSDAKALWSKLSQLQTPETNTIIHVLIGLFVIFLGGRTMAAGFITLFSKKPNNSESPSADPVEQDAAADLPCE